MHSLASLPSIDVYFDVLEQNYLLSFNFRYCKLYTLLIIAFESGLLQGEMLMQDQYIHLTP